MGLTKYVGWALAQWQHIQKYVFASACEAIQWRLRPLDCFDTLAKTEPISLS